MTEPRRFPPPWSVDQATESFCIRDAHGLALAYAYYVSRLAAVLRSGPRSK